MKWIGICKHCGKEVRSVVNARVWAFAMEAHLEKCIGQKRPPKVDRISFTTKVEKIRVKRPKVRKPTAKGQIAHKDKKKYDRKRVKKENINDTRD